MDQRRSNQSGRCKKQGRVPMGARTKVDMVKCHFCLHSIGQKQVTRPHLTVGDAGHWSIPVCAEGEYTGFVQMLVLSSTGRGRSWYGFNWSICSQHLQEKNIEMENNLQLKMLSSSLLCSICAIFVCLHFSFFYFWEEEVPTTQSTEFWWGSPRQRRIELYIRLGPIEIVSI